MGTLILLSSSSVVGIFNKICSSHSGEMRSGKNAYIVFLEVPTLNHKVLDHPVEGAALVAVPFLTCTPKAPNKRAAMLVKFDS